MTSDKQPPHPVNLDVDIQDVFEQIRLNNDAFLVTEALEDILVARLAQQADIAAADSEVDAEIDAFRVRLGLHRADDLAAWLDARKLTPSDLSRKMRQLVLKDKLARAVTEPILDDHFAQKHAQYDVFGLAQIVVAHIGDARELYRLLTQDGLDFTELARQHSLDDATAEQGGFLGYVVRRDLPAGFAAQLSNSRVGQVEVFGPLEVSQRFVIYRAQFVREAQLDPPLRSEIRRELFAGWLKSQREASGLARKAASLLQGRSAEAREQAAAQQVQFSRRDLAAGIVATALAADLLTSDQARFAFDRASAAPRLPSDRWDAEAPWAPSGTRPNTAVAQNRPPPPPPPPPPPRRPPAIAGVRG
jgi:peptidylprolyl isomerase